MKNKKHGNLVRAMRADKRQRMGVSIRKRIRMRRGFFAVGSPVDYRKGDPTGTVGTRLCPAKYLTEEEQLALVDIMEDLEVTPSLSQAIKLKDLSASHRLDPDTMYEVMEKPKANQRETVKLDADTLRRFFPDYTPKQMETAILRMLEEAERERQRQKILRRSRDDAR